MADRDINRLELDIVAVDSTGDATKSAKANFRSVEQEASRSAAGVSNSLDRQSVAFARSVEAASASAMRNLEKLEARAALAGKTGVEKLVALRERSNRGLGGDEAAIQRNVAAYDKLIGVEQRLAAAKKARIDLADKERAFRQSATLAGQAILPGEAEFAAALKRNQENAQAIAKLQRARILATETPVERTARERSEALSVRGLTPSQYNQIEAEFFARSIRDKQAEQAAIDATAARELKAHEAKVSQLEKEAALAGKTGAARAAIRRDLEIGEAKAAGASAQQIERIAASYAKLIAAEKLAEGAHSNPKRLLLALKDASEGYTRGATIEVADYFVGTGGQGGILRGAAGSISEITGLSKTAVIAVGGLAAGLLALDFAGLKAAHSLGEYGTQIRNFSLRTGIPGTEYQSYEYAAKLSGQDVGVFDKLTRGLAQIADDNSPAGAKGRQELKRLGVNPRDGFGDLKPTTELLLELSDAINKLPPGLQQSAANMEIFKRVGIESLPAVKGLREAFQRSAELGPTVSNADIEKFEQYHKALADFSTEFDRFKIKVEKPLAFVATASVKGFSFELWLAQAAGGLLGNFFNKRPGAEGVSFPAPDLHGFTEKVLESGIRRDTDAQIRSFRSSQGIKFEIEQAKKELSAFAIPEEGVAYPPDELPKYQAAFRRVQQLEATQKSLTAGSQDRIAVAKEQLQLNSQLAEIEASSKQRDIRARLDRSKELAGPEDIASILALTRNRADRETQQKIEDRRYRVDENGNLVDDSGTRGFQRFASLERGLEPLRLKAETAKVLSDFKELDDRYFQARADADFKAFEEAQHRKTEAQHSLISEAARLDAEARSHYFEAQSTENEREKTLALSQLGLVNAQSVQEKQKLEDQKLAIENSYAERSLAIQIQKIQSEESVELGKLQGLANVAGPEGQPYYDEAKADVVNKANADIANARQSTSDKELIAAREVANEKTKLGIEQNRKIFDNLKQAAGGLFDALFEKSKSFADVLKGLFKTAILTPIKDIFSSQVAGIFTELITGQKVSFNEIGSGEGRFGRASGLLGRLGLGSPRFGVDHGLANVNQPNHLGDVNLISGAVPVVIVNGNNSSLAIEASGAGVPGLAHSLASLPLIPGSITGAAKALRAAAGGGSAVSSSVTYPDGSTDFSPNPFSRQGLNNAAFEDAIGSRSIFGSGPFAAGPLRLIPSPTESVESGGSAFGYKITYPDGSSESPGGPGTSGLDFGPVFGQLPGAPPFQGSGDTVGYDALDEVSGKGGGGGFFSKLGGLFGGGQGGGFFKGLGGFFGKAPATQSLVTDPFGNPLPGAPALSGLKALQGSPAASLAAGLGIGFALDGIRRGGIGGALEAAGGGAAIGFKFGGVQGALIGAGIGAGISLIKSLFGDDRGHTKDLVKQVYGIRINDATADQIIQIAKQSYGGQISVAVRSQQVRDLLRLYAQTTGQKNPFVADKAHSASLVEASGKLYQNAVYDNGQAYSYQSPLSVYGGVQTSTLPTSGPLSGGPSTVNLQLALNGDSALNALGGQVVRVATPGFVQGQAIRASQSSNGRLDQTALTLAPAAITR